MLPTCKFSVCRLRSLWLCSTPSLMFSASATRPSSNARWSGRNLVQKWFLSWNQEHFWESFHKAPKFKLYYIENPSPGISWRYFTLFHPSHLVQFNGKPVWRIFYSFFEPIDFETCTWRNHSRGQPLLEENQASIYSVQRVPFRHRVPQTTSQTGSAARSPGCLWLCRTTHAW